MEARLAWLQSRARNRDLLHFSTPPARKETMAAMASVMSVPAVGAPRSLRSSKVAIRGARVMGVKTVAPRPAAVRAHASAARVDAVDDLQLGQVCFHREKRKIR